MARYSKQTEEKTAHPALWAGFFSRHSSHDDQRFGVSGRRYPDFIPMRRSQDPAEPGAGRPAAGRFCTSKPSGASVTKETIVHFSAPEPGDRLGSHVDSESRASVLIPDVFSRQGGRYGGYRPTSGAPVR